MLEILIADLTDLRLWLFVLIVSAVGLAEKLAFYRAGQRSADADLSRVPGINLERRTRLEAMFMNRGTYILLLASIPGIGAAMTAVAGNVGVAIATFVIWVTISNLIRNWLIVILSGQLAILF
jgi:membrane protein YqaA with SNARE-associated domain